MNTTTVFEIVAVILFALSGVGVGDAENFKLVPVGLAFLTLTLLGPIHL